MSFDTLTPMDVIMRSVLLHPSLFHECLIEAGCVHDSYAFQCAIKHVSNIARDAGSDCKALAYQLRKDDPAKAIHQAIGKSTGRLVQAFTVAARLQLIPRATQSDMLARHDAGESRS